MALQRGPRFVRLAGLVILAALLGTFTISLFFRQAYEAPGVAVFAHRGAVTFATYNVHTTKLTLAFDRWGFVWPSAWYPYRSVNSPIRALIIPLWMPIAAAAGATFWAHRRIHRFAPGRCGRCGYDLTGNVSGVCPECGQPIDRGLKGE